ncbi:Atypical/PIKK/PI3K protein kinase [Rhodotorula toruloides ATCC 204091]|uniref:Phosphatidylinositol 3-kinase VPS34 n=1 Tax=Rhodotorula toruloides TaxID=5286 RepID=A0A0K3C710_RHOTO|nr:Atypical/PIKK/PI3K protein kinase [Rhodotorula toruloides ATCC 204091]PRQ77644.1 Atypical/PIKK/PI3K protein kinase [Rhodotorula toruloides]
MPLESGLDSLAHPGSASCDSQISFLKHGDLAQLVAIKVASFEGHIPQRPLTDLLDHPELKHHGFQQQLPSDLFVRVELWADNKPLIPPVQTAHKAFKSRTQIDWNEHITLPIKYRDLPLGSQLAVTVYDIAGPGELAVVGGSTLRLFGNKCTLKKGKQRLFLWKGKEADGSVETETPSKVGLKDEMGRLEKLAESEKSENLFLYIDLPRFDFPVVFCEPEYPLPVLSSLTLSSTAVPPSTSTATAQGSSTSAGTSAQQAAEASLFTIVDPEIVRKNPVEAKHRRLVRDHRNGPLDRELKPNAKIRDELNEILRYPPTQELTTPQRDLLWKFRFYLTRDKRALTKFLKSVVWSDPGEAKQAVETLLPMWSEIEMDDALELLGPAEGFRDRRVRAYAVRQLERADDEELMLYLLQLVQALKFEPASSSTSPTSSHVSPSASLRHSHAHIHRHGSSLRPTAASPHDSLPTLEDFLVERSAKNPVLGNHFYWYIQVEREAKARGSMFEGVARNFERRMQELQQEGEPDRLETLRRQSEFIARITQLASSLRLSKDARPKKIEKLRSAIHSSSTGLSSFSSPIPLPLDARVSITGIDAETSSVFKSNLFPLRLQLLTTSGEPYPVIFKNGDDLRQDQLVIQLFTLMDRLLRKENLDLKLMPYRVLATGALDGMVQFVPSRTLQDITFEYGAQGLLGYLRENHADPGSVGTYDVKPEVLDTYIRSCAGYCVVTYLLGVGDRHLDNLLLSPDGHFFHVDFGYILGRDPKPFPPAVKVCKEMVDAMGGMHSPHYARFKSLCYTGFTTLRKNANLLINLVALMVDGNIPDIKLEPDKAVMKADLIFSSSSGTHSGPPPQVQDKFLLNLTEEEAIKEFEALLNDTSYFTSVLDRIHSVAQYWRS